MERQDRILKYGAILRQRITKTQKIRFLNELEKEIEGLGYQGKVQASLAGKEQCLNYTSADIEKADFVIATYYDTPFKTWGLAPYQPQNPGANKLMRLLAMVLPLTLVIALEGLFLYFVVINRWQVQPFNGLDVLIVLGLAALLLCGIVWRKGIPNRYNVVRNTSSIIAMLEVMEQIPKSQKHRVGFAWVDFGCINGLGYESLQTQLKPQQNKPKIIWLDCVGAKGQLYAALGSAGEVFEGVERLDEAINAKTFQLFACDPQTKQVKQANTSRDIALEDTQLDLAIQQVLTWISKK